MAIASLIGTGSSATGHALILRHGRAIEVDPLILVSRLAAPEMTVAVLTWRADLPERDDGHLVSLLARPRLEDAGGSEPQLNTGSDRQPPRLARLQVGEGIA